jgi:FkbM family methyltransferase
MSDSATITLTLVDGTRVVVPDSLENFTSYVLQERGDWFEDEIGFLRRLVQPGQVVIDIGANVGVYALSLARRVGPKGRVWAFEPATDTAALLAEGIAANGSTWVQLVRQAVSDHTGMAWLQKPGHPELHSLAPSVPEAGAINDQDRGEEVEVTTLDASLHRFGWQHVDILKIDAEGEEERILAGGVQLLRECSPLVMFEVKAEARFHLELVDRFQQLGYGLFRLVPGLDVLAPFDASRGVDGYLVNLFAAKSDRAMALAAVGKLVQSSQPAPPPVESLPVHHGNLTVADVADQAPPMATPLALWSFAQDTSQGTEQRLGALIRSYQMLTELAQESWQISRFSSLARVAGALGERTAALRALGQLIPALEAGVEPSPEEPLLPPSPRFDAIAPDGRLREWLLAAALEADELLGHSSSFLTGDRARPRLERLHELGFNDEAMSRRIRLLNRRFPPLDKASPELEVPNADQIACSREAWQLIKAGDIRLGSDRLSMARQMGDTCSESLYWIGKCYIALDNYTAGVNCLQRSLELCSGHAGVLLTLGLALKKRGDRAASQALFHQAILLYGFLSTNAVPEAGDYYNLGLAYQELGDDKQALDFFRLSLQQDPTNTACLIRKARALIATKIDHDEAIEALDLALSIDPKDEDAISLKASLLAIFGDVSESIQLLRGVIDRNPKHDSAYRQLAFAYSISGEKAVSKHLANLQDFWNFIELNHASQVSSHVSLSLPAHGQKLRIGFLSAELGDHVVSLFLEPFLKHYDRNRFEVELIEAQEHNGDWADWIASNADAVVSVEGLSVQQARELLLSRAYHVIIETTGYTSNSVIHILAKRCALVQCHYIGFHASTGLRTIDWFIGDRTTAACDLQPQFVEGLWQLPRSWLACENKTDLWPDPSWNGEFQARPVFGSFNQFAKVREDTIEFWAAALHAVPAAELHLKNYTSDSERPRRRILALLEKQGIDPVRIKFLPRTETYIQHMELYKGIDVALDTTPWSGATTTVEALVMGVPVAGIYGRTMAGRMTCSLLSSLGKESWYASSPVEYAHVVATIALSFPRLRMDRQLLREAVLASSIFDGVDLANQLQDALTEMVGRACAQPESQDKAC